MELSKVERSKPVMDIIIGYQKSKILFSAVKLGIFEAIAKSGPQEVSELSKTLNLSQDGLERLVNACASLGFIRKTESNKLDLTECSREFLLESSETPFTGYISHSNDILYPLWSNLDTAVR